MIRMLLVLAFVSVLGAANVSAEDVVRYRLTEWKRQHLHDATKATKIAETLTKIGCEVQKAAHNGHIDVKYRCPEWKQMKLDSAEDAKKWEAWLKGFKFETEMPQ